MLSGVSVCAITAKTEPSQFCSCSDCIAHRDLNQCVADGLRTYLDTLNHNLGLRDDEASKLDWKDLKSMSKFRAPKRINCQVGNDF